MMQLMMPLIVSMITIKARTLKNRFRFTFGIDCDSSPVKFLAISGLNFLKIQNFFSS